MNFRAFFLSAFFSVFINAQPSIIPAPLTMNLRSGNFTIGPKTSIVYHFSNTDVKPAAEYLARQLRTVTGYAVPLKDAKKLPKQNYIFLNFTRDEELGNEGYTVDVDSLHVYLEPNNQRGFFYAVQTFLQLLPPAVYAPSKQHSEWKVPSVYIYDKPRFSWRGMHLDVSRHFFPVSFIKTYIDMLAMHKLNVFHWHVTDDQGWRVEIKKYPKLMNVSAWRVDRENQHWNFRDPPRPGDSATYGGFYTQKEIREIVRYAAERNITVVPEIEMPAHATAALAAYPQYSCTGGPFAVPPGGVWPITDIFCAGNDSTFFFLQDVLSEVMNLFPGTYIHIGGDEADKKEWKRCVRCQSRIQKEGLRDETELQSYFVKRIERFISSKGKKLIGWDEILEGGIAPSATVMSWRGEAGGIAAARSGHDAVMSPGGWCYFDHYQGPEYLEPPAFVGYTPLSKVYSYDPVPESLSVDEAKHILGTQANLWTEYILSPSHAQYMTLPRMAAIAEVGWSSKESRDWKNFASRIETQMSRYTAAGYNFAQSVYLATFNSIVDSINKSIRVSMSTEMPNTVIRYSLDGSDPSASSPEYTQPMNITQSTLIRAASFKNEKRMSKISQQQVFGHKAMFKPYTLEQPLKKYTGGTSFALTNGIRGSLSFNDGNWVGFDGNDLDAQIDLGEMKSISKISTTFLQNTSSWIFFPVNVEISISDSGMVFVPVKKIELTPPVKNEPNVIQEIAAEFTVRSARYVRVRAKNLGIIPEWHVGKGETGYMFVDEIIVE